MVDDLVLWLLLWLLFRILMVLFVLRVLIWNWCGCRFELFVVVLMYGF